MSANLEQQTDRFCLLRVGGELKKSELDAAQSEFVKKIAGVGPAQWEAQVLAFSGAGLRQGPIRFFPETDEAEARARLAD